MVLLQSRSLALPGAIALCMACAWPNRTSAEAPGAHQHGVAELRIVIEGSRLEVVLETPLDNMVGFEHAPRNDRQRDAVRAMASKLRQPQMFLPTPAARCKSVSTKLESGVLPPELLGESGTVKPAPAQPAAKGEQHADLDATYIWNCEAPPQLNGLDTALMQTFRGLRQVDVQIVGPTGQSATRLKQGQRSLAW
jgi:Protein of unknown function (DUF2796)